MISQHSRNHPEDAKQMPSDQESEMGRTPATPESINALEAVRADIAELKASVASLFEHLQIGANEVKADLGDGLKEEAGKLSQQMRELFDRFSAGTAKTTNSLEQQVQAQPIRTLALAVGVGFVLSRLMGSRK